MLELRKMSEYDLTDVLQLAVDSHQSNFVAPIHETLNNLQSAIPHLIFAEDRLVGFFLLDPDYCLNYDFCPTDGLGLRAFFIDSQYQGKGFARSAIQSLTPYVKQEWQDFNSVWLTVNCKNSLAYACYLKHGFQDTGELYLGGSAGPQQIMLLSINN